MPDTTALANELRELLAKATPGEWGDVCENVFDDLDGVSIYAYGTDGSHIGWFSDLRPTYEEAEPTGREMANASLVIAAHNHLPALLDYIDDIEKILIKLSKKDLAQMDRIAELEECAMQSIDIVIIEEEGAQ